MGYNLLIVDDSSTTRSIIKKILGMSTLQIGNLFEAGNGADALEKMKANWIDLVFADINMPRMNGVEMVNMMQEDSVMKSIPVIIVSSDGSEARIEELRTKGVKAYLKKPFTPETIREAAMSMLGKEPSHEE